MSTRTDSWKGSHWIRDEKRIAIYHRDGWRCSYCGATQDLSLDHVDPAPPHDNSPTNLLTACLTCNKRKGTKPLAHVVPCVLRRRWLGMRSVRPLNLKLAKNFLEVSRAFG